MAIVLAQGLDELARVSLRSRQGQAAGRPGSAHAPSAGALDGGHGLGCAVGTNQNVAQRDQCGNLVGLLRECLSEPDLCLAQGLHFCGGISDWRGCKRNPRPGHQTRLPVQVAQPAGC